MLYYLDWVQVEQEAAVIQAHWGQHYSGVAAAITDTTDKDEDIVEEDTVDEEMFVVETIEEVEYGETGSLDGSSSIQETKNYVGLVAISRSSRS